MFPRSSQRMLRGWRETLILGCISATLCCAKKYVGGGVEVLDILSTVTGTFTQMLDDDLSLTISYDLADDSRVPISFVTGIGVTKRQDIFRTGDPTEPIARLTLSGSIMTKGRIPSGGFVLEANDRSLGVNVNHAIRRAQFRFGRTLLDGRVKVGLSPLVTYGALRRSSVDFGKWVPSYRPFLSEAGLPRGCTTSLSSGKTWLTEVSRGRGLYNDVKTCYLNATIQCLAHLPPLARYFLSADYTKVDEVASVAVAAALDFLQSPSRRNLVGMCTVLAAEDGSRALEALQKHVPRLAEESGERRLVVRACALPDVVRAGTPCSCIVNPCNWRLAEGGGRTNVLVHRAAGDCLRRASLVGRTRAFVAEPFPVEIPPESPLRAEGGVQTVIQVLGPNLDPRFPDCLVDKPEEARRLLRLTYDRTLECFWDLTMRSAHLGDNGSSGWRGVLYCFLQKPRSSAAQAEIFYEDELCVVAYDGHPKSRFHLLLLPKLKVLDVKVPSALRRENLPVLRRLHAVGNAVAQALTQQGAGAVRCGYHSIPSLHPLHLHIISQDFDSPGLKKKNHLNSFITDFFLSSSWVEARLSERGHLDLDKDRYKRLVAHPLRCFRCERVMSNIKAFKAHNRTCAKLAPE